MKYKTMSVRRKTTGRHYFKLVVNVLTMVLLLTASAFSINLAKVFAASAYSLNFTTSGNHTLEVSDGHLKIDGQYIDLKNGDQTIGTASCTSATSCSIAVTDGASGKLNYNSADRFTLYINGNPHNMDTTFNSTTNIAVQDYENNNNNQPVFSGKVWFFWNCNGNFCKQKLTGLNPATFNESTGDLVYDTNYIPAHRISDNGNSPDVASLNKTGAYLWVWETPGDTTVAQNLTTWGDFQAYFKRVAPESDYDALKAYAIDPTGAQSGNNSLNTNGDRAFRATIYGDGYYGVTNASMPSDLTYYPSFWDKAFFNPAYDISGTSIDNPAVIQTYLLEPVITLESDISSSPIRNIEIADSTPASAVSITRDGGSFTITFNSNYYDHTIFKVTDYSEHTHYFMLGRITVDRDGNLFVPTTDDTEYEVYGTYTLENGTRLFLQLERNTPSDTSGGQNLDLRAYKLKAGDSGKVNYRPDSANAIKKVVFTVVKASENIADDKPSATYMDFYQGTLAGSGRGTGYVIGSNGQISFDTNLAK